MKDEIVFAFKLSRVHMRIFTSQWSTKSSLNTSKYGFINIIMMVSTNVWLYIVFLNTVFQDYFHCKPFEMDRAAERNRYSYHSEDKRHFSELGA